MLKITKIFKSGLLRFFSFKNITNMRRKLKDNKLVLKKNIERHYVNIFFWPLCPRKERIEKIYAAFRVGKV